MTEKKNKSVKLVVKIKEIKLLGFQVTEYGNDLKDPIDDDKYQVEFELASNLNAEIKSMETLLTVKLLDKSNDVSPLPLLATMRIRFDLLIRNFDEIIIIENGASKLPSDLITIALGSTIGAARGMFVLCSSVYKFSNAIIPLINVEQLMKNMKSTTVKPIQS